MSAKWIFFDIGDVLFNEDAPHVLYFHSLLAAMRRHGVQVTWDEYHAAIIDCVKKSPGDSVTDAASSFVSDPALWEQIFHEGRGVYEAIRKPRPYGVLLDNITEVVHKLRPHFKLGIIANQHIEVVQALDDYGIAKLFDVKVIDKVVGVSKPDPGIFEIALKEAACTPHEAVMVGDRPDNDIYPANKLGMRTVRFRRGLLYVHYEPQSALERPDIEVTQTSALADAIMHLANS